MIKWFHHEITSQDDQLISPPTIVAGPDSNVYQVKAAKPCGRFEGQKGDFPAGKKKFIHIYQTFYNYTLGLEYFEYYKVPQNIHKIFPGMLKPQTTKKILEKSSCFSTGVLLPFFSFFLSFFFF